MFFMQCVDRVQYFIIVSIMWNYLYISMMIHKVMKFYEMLNSSEDMQKKLAKLDKAFAEKHAAPSADAGAEAINSFQE